MKLSLLEDGVLDYKGPNRVLATPSANPAGALGARIKPAPGEHIGSKQRFEEHIEECPQCDDTLCDVGQLLFQNL